MTSQVDSALRRFHRAHGQIVVTDPNPTVLARAIKRAEWS
jgi:hypothetical protein